MKRIIYKYNRLLAAEYVLGTLQGLAQRRYQSYVETYPELNQVIDQWQRDLGALAEALPESKPPPQLWQKIEGKLKGSLKT